MFAAPVTGLLTLTLILMAWFLVDGIFGVIAGLQVRPAQGWGWMVFSGAISMLLAILLWRGWPATGAVAIGLLVGIRLVFTGWSIAMLGAVADSVSDAIETEAAAGSSESNPGG